MRRIGLVVNPIAGMGGRVGLKGTDNKLEEARRRGAEPRSPSRAQEALSHLREQSAEVEVYTYGGVMGENEATAAGFSPTIVGRPDSEETTAADTREAVRRLVEAAVDLVLFVGGDGTAVDVAGTLEALDAEVPVLGVPGGVKVYSSVFAVTPRAAGRIAASVPVGEEVQSSKQIGGGTVEALAEAVAGDLRDEVGTYVLGPGSTVDAVKTELGFAGSPLGVDVWRDSGVVAADAAASDIVGSLGDRNVVVVSPIGGQGFVFGRGNDQISPEIIRRSEVEVIASKQKLDDIGVLRVDTGDPRLDEELRGWQRVRVGKFERRLLKMV
ncbi:N-acetylglucosamine-1-phosphate uridyltransferase [Halobacteriales archaeon QS_9_68_42]|nr:MAG: N-acetylglucosamine-1-phosphate uridyltransferase [Halobacteriales archaeon QS_9_68_42]